MIHKLSRKCNCCDKEEIFNLSKMEASMVLFESFSELVFPCSGCGSFELEQEMNPYPQLDDEILDEWGRDEGLSFAVRDETEFLAEWKSLPEVFSELDYTNYLQSKKKKLFDALYLVSSIAPKRVNRRICNQPIRPVFLEAEFKMAGFHG